MALGWLTRQRQSDAVVPRGRLGARQRWPRACLPLGPHVVLKAETQVSGLLRLSSSKGFCLPQVDWGAGWLVLFIYLMFIFERERERVGEGQREGETQDSKQAPGSERSAQGPTWGSDS